MFKGIWVANTLTSGECMYPDGSRYTGAWLSGQPHGQGHMYWAAERREFEGEFADGDPAGVGGDRKPRNPNEVRMPRAPPLNFKQ